MTLELIHCTPAFPLELEREIFETTALMHHREIPTLLRVARRVLVWIEPLLYRVIRVTRKNKDAILTAIRSKPADFFPKAVRHLCLDFFIPEHEAREILEVCSGVINLGLDDALSNPALLPILANLPLEWLATSLCGLFREDIMPKHPLFASITHLDLFDPDIWAITQILPHIPTFPALTHLALDSLAVSVDRAQTLLAECPRLHLLLLLWQLYSGDYTWTQIPHVYDVRFVIGLSPADYWGDWEDGAKGLPHLWSLGDDLVAGKRSKTIEATRYWL
ncbi:hypothetical protein B0H13DRAFT_2067792 [Mycena leptocephala]|nr:hypothetical protein B0H13DRAFT_2075227 [Mycena leptocephala]KAJ7865390.1 hypothetical protein B0H13DRAFT_2067792 [Mycena leptocephala]